MKHLDLDTIAMLLLVIGGLNAGIAAVLGYDVLGQVMNSGVSTVFYALVGMSALYALVTHVAQVREEA